MSFINIPGKGNVFGPESATNNTIPRFNGTDGTTLKDSGIVIDDNNNITGVNSLTVETLISTTTISTDDNIILLNDLVTGSPSIDAGIEVERGTSINARLLWDETNDYWTAGIIGTMSKIILDSDTSSLNLPNTIVKRDNAGSFDGNGIQIDTLDIGDPGTEAGGINVNGTVYNSILKVNAIDGIDQAQLVLHRHNTVFQPLLIGARSNSDDASHVDVVNGMTVFSIHGVGYAGTNYKEFARFEINVDDTGTISNTSSPGQFLLKLTPDGSVLPVQILKIINTGEATFANDITAPTFIGNLTGNASGSAASFTGSLSGDVTGTQGSTAISTSTITSKLITGFVSGAGSISASDSILSAINKLDGNDALKLPLAGGTMSGVINMGSNKITSLANGVNPGDAVNKAQLDAASAGFNWLNPIEDPDLIDDSLTAPPGSPVSGVLYLVNTPATGVWTGLEGRVLQYNGVSWDDILGRVVAIGDRFGVTLEHGSGGAAGGLTGKHNNIAQLTNATPGAYAYSFHAPVDKDAVSVNNDLSSHFGNSYEYDSNTGAWIEFVGPGALSVGDALAFAGATLNVLYDNSTIKLNGSNQLFVQTGNLSTSTTGITIGGGTNSVVGSGSTINIQTASGSQPGLLSSGDWNIFNNKQPAGNYITALTGEVTASGPGSAAATLSNAAVIAKTLTSFVSGAGTVSAADSIFTAIQKLDGNIALKANLSGATFTGPIKTAGQSVAVTTKSGTYSVLSTDELIRCDGTFPVNLPAATGSGRIIRIKNINIGTITAVPNGTDTIDGESNMISNSIYDCMTLCDGASGKWDLI